MKETKTPLSIKLIYWLTNFAFWMMTAIVIIILIANIMYVTVGYDHNLPVQISMPIPVDVNEIGTVNIGEDVFNVQIVDAYGKMKFIDAPSIIMRWFVHVVLLTGLMGWFVIWRLKEFTYNIRNGKIFDLVNINKLKQVAYGLLALYITSRIYMGVLSIQFQNNLEMSSISLGSKLYDTDSIIIASVVLWALAHIFMKGVEMKQEQELTI